MTLTLNLSRYVLVEYRNNFRPLLILLINILCIYTWNGQLFRVPISYIVTSRSYILSCSRCVCKRTFIECLKSRHLSMLCTCAYLLTIRSCTSMYANLEQMTAIIKANTQIPLGYRCIVEYINPNLQQAFSLLN